MFPLCFVVAVMCQVFVGLLNHYEKKGHYAKVLDIENGNHAVQIAALQRQIRQLESDVLDYKHAYFGCMKAFVYYKANH
jgi:hypothetical protein